MHNEHSFFNLLFISFFLHFKVYCVVFFFLCLVPTWDSFPISLCYCTRYDCAMTIKSYLILLLCQRTSLSSTNNNFVPFYSNKTVLAH